MATFQCTYQWTRRFLRGREGATLCRHTQIVRVTDEILFGGKAHRYRGVTRYGVALEISTCFLANGV